MLATPVTKRAGSGASPTKRAARRVAAEIESTQTVPQVDHLTLVVEVHKLYAQSRKDQEHFDALTDATNQHASRIDDVKMDIGGLASDLKLVAADVLRNDGQLKENLKKLEELVTGLGNRESELKGNLKKLEEVVIGQGEAIRNKPGLQGETVTAEAYVSDLSALDIKVKQELVRLESMIQDIEADAVHKRLAELQSSMTAMGDGIQRRFETLESNMRPWPSSGVQGGAPGVATAEAPTSVPQRPVPAFPFTQTPAATAEPPPQVYQQPQQAPAHHQQQQRPQHYHYGDRDRDSTKSLFDDKVAVADVMRYPSNPHSGTEVPVEKKIGWSKSARNYFISKAQEMELVLVWAKSFRRPRSRPSTLKHWGTVSCAWTTCP